MKTKSLSRDDKLKAFKIATGGFARSSERWRERAQTGLTDKELADALAYEIGIFGGRGGRDELSVTYQGAGLKIWADWRVLNHVTETPIFEDRSTIAMARDVYGIHDPSDNQFAMF